MHPSAQRWATKADSSARARRGLHLERLDVLHFEREPNVEPNDTCTHHAGSRCHARRNDERLARNGVILPNIATTEDHQSLQCTLRRVRIPFCMYAAMCAVPAILPTSWQLKKLPQAVTCSWQNDWVPHAKHEAYPGRPAAVIQSCCPSFGTCRAKATL